MAGSYSTPKRSALFDPLLLCVEGEKKIPAIPYLEKVKLCVSNVDGRLQCKVPTKKLPSNNTNAVEQLSY